MKIALFSDIHANLPALEACLQNIDEQNADAIYCLGDLVGYNVWPNEIIQEIRRRGIPTIKGNYDEGIGLNSTDCGCAYKTDLDKELGAISIAYTNDLVQPAERRYLRTLPARIRVEFQFNKAKLNLLLVHGSPRKINEYLFEDREENSLVRIMEQAEADIMCFGHTHQPYHRILPTTTTENTRYKHAINIGSVGKPKDGDPRGCYVLLTIPEDLSLQTKDSVTVKFIRFDYEVEKAALAIEKSFLPNEYAAMLRQAF